MTDFSTLPGDLYSVVNASGRGTPVEIPAQFPTCHADDEGLDHTAVVYDPDAFCDDSSGPERAAERFPTEKVAAQALEHTALPLTAETVTLDFEDLSGIAQLSAEYRGLTWTNFYHFDTSDPTSSSYGAHFGATSGTMSLYNGSGQSASVQSPDPADDFDFISANFTATLLGGWELKVSAYDDGVLVGQEVITMEHGNPVFWEFGPEFESVDEVVFAPELATGVGFNVWFYEMDDMTIVPHDGYDMM
ncbi:hypothetical protein [Palleronia caenipelagi]|uniref:Uncharacterized protein n=1 Tax=Palleronia caenipelagi TaxID=2489174 RepID=A0A547PT88_9RHOB|nr:hypothetical protein [Palleronia caenipelagi]TRD17357.1 hypothetical protein FEV53_13025 [Palleronia caenipelagi]